MWLWPGVLAKEGVLWMAPFYTLDGYTSEALAFAASLADSPGFGIRNFALQQDPDFARGLLAQLLPVVRGPLLTL